MTKSQIAAAVERAERRARGEDPFATPAPPTPAKPKRAKKTVTLPASDYQRLLEAAECDDMITTCEVCGAWMDKDDPAYLHSEDWNGCVYYATGLERDKDLCRRYRSDLCKNKIPK